MDVGGDWQDMEAWAFMVRPGDLQSGLAFHIEPWAFMLKPGPSQ